MADYARLSLFEVQDLNYYDYLVLRRDAFISKMNQSEQGREYLDNAYRLTLTEPDKNELRRKFGGN